MPPLFLQTIEQTALSTWLRDSTSIFGFWFVLTWHAIGMALLVGASAVVDLLILGAARGVPPSTLRRLYPIIWTGFSIQLVTGVLLLIAYPTKSLMTPVFYVKLGCIVAAMLVMTRLEKRLASEAAEDSMPAHARRLAVWSLLLWLGAITAGRLIAYTAPYIVYPL